MFVVGNRRPNNVCAVFFIFQLRRLNSGFILLTLIKDHISTTRALRLCYEHFVEVSSSLPLWLFSS